MSVHDRLDTGVTVGEPIYFAPHKLSGVGITDRPYVEHGMTQAQVHRRLLDLGLFRNGASLQELQQWLDDSRRDLWRDVLDAIADGRIANLDQARRIAALALTAEDIEVPGP